MFEPNARTQLVLKHLSTNIYANTIMLRLKSTQTDFNLTRTRAISTQNKKKDRENKIIKNKIRFNFLFFKKIPNENHQLCENKISKNNNNNVNYFNHLNKKEVKFKEWLLI